MNCSAEPSALSLPDRLKFLARDSVLYGGAAAVNKVFGLVTFPLLARYFAVEDYGAIDYFTIVAHLLGTFFIFGQDSAVARFFYEHTGQADRRELASQSLVLQLGVLALLLPPLWLAADALVAQFGAPYSSGRLLKLVLLQVPFIVLLNFSQNLLKWTFARSRFLLLALGSVATNFACLSVAVTLFRVSVEGIFIVFLLVQSLFGLLALISIRRWLVLPTGFRFLKDLIPFALPFGVVCCVAAFMPALERTLVSGLLGTRELGLYAAGTKVAMLVAMVASAFQTAWGPFALAIHKEQDAADTYNWVVRVFVLVICVSVLSLSAIARPLIDVLATGRYSGAAVVVFPLAMGLAIQATSWITEIGITLSKKSYLGLISYIVFVGTTISAVQLLVTPFALGGVATGVMLGHALKALTASWLAQRAYRLPWQFSPVLAILAATVVVGLTGTWASTSIEGTRGPAVFAAGAIGIGVAGWFGLFTLQERHRVFRVVRSVAGV